MKCPHCQHENRLAAKFCEECATPFARACSRCGTQLAPTAKFCPECAHPAGAPARFGAPEAYTPHHLAEKILTSRSALEGERKQVTVLFADLKGSMELLAERDPEEARKFLDPVLELMMEAVHGYEGTVNQVMGDGIIALFGAPLAHEDHAVRACYAALQPWPDFMTYYGSLTTGAGWIVPKRYTQQVGDDGFKKLPVGAGPYRFVSFTPGIELVLEAHEHYWRKVPSVKRLVFKVAQDESTRLAMLKRGEADIVYLLQAELAEEVRRTSGLTLRPTPIVSTHWLIFADQWDPKSPWADKRVRLAANYAMNRQAVNEALTLGFSRITWSIIPASFDFYWQPPAYPYDPAKAKQLLAEAGYPRGFDAGDLWCDAATATMSEALIGYLQAVGIRVKLRPLERAAFFKGYQEKKLKNIIYTITGTFGNAATRLETCVASGGPYAYGGYPDIDGLFREQAGELDRKRREAMLHRIQQLVHEKAMYAPIWELGFIHAQGPRVAESGLGLIAGWAFSAPYEDVKLRGK